MLIHQYPAQYPAHNITPRIFPTWKVLGESLESKDVVVIANAGVDRRCGESSGARSWSSADAAGRIADAGDGAESGRSAKGRRGESESGTAQETMRRL